MNPIQQLCVDGDFKYLLVNGLVLVEEDTTDNHLEKVTLSEEDAALVPSMKAKDLRFMMYQYSPYN